MEHSQKDGLLISKPVLADAINTMSAASRLLALTRNAPYPHAARVFLNWPASREGVEVFSRGQLHATTRTDVDK